MLNQAETLFSVALEAPLDPAGLSAFLQRRVAVYDKDREGHYNLISALHKSIRGSDPQAARSEEHTSELQSLMRTSYAVFCLKQQHKDTRLTYPSTSQ